jgi:hypothetical protein
MISGDGNITLVLNGEQFFIVKEDSSYDKVRQALSDNASAEELLVLVDKEKEVADYVHSTDIQIKNGCVFYNGEEVHNTLTDRILTFMKEGLPVAPLVNFLEKLMQNPSYSARQELFDFLEHKHLPVTEDGDFLAYKAVNSTYMDKYTGKFSNAIGSSVEMVRWNVDDDRGHGCASGLHAGTLEYVQSYGSFHDGDGADKCIIVKINPTDVVSVPTDSNCQKLRTCKYLVLRDYEGKMEYNLYTDDGDEWDDDYDPYEDEDYVDNSSENDLFAPPSSKPVNKGESYRWN